LCHGLVLWCRLLRANNFFLAPTRQAPPAADVTPLAWSIRRTLSRLEPPFPSLDFQLFFEPGLCFPPIGRSGQTCKRRLGTFPGAIGLNSQRELTPLPLAAIAASRILLGQENGTRPYPSASEFRCPKTDPNKKDVQGSCC